MRFKRRMKFLHGSDLHMDHAHRNRLDAFIRRLKTTSAEDTVLLLTGDTTVANQTKHYDELSKTIKTLAVMGNHDFWYGNWDETRDKVQSVLSANGSSLLDREPNPIQMENVAIVGDSCWYDAMAGNSLSSRLVMNDWFFIENFSQDSYNTGSGYYTNFGSHSLNRNSIISRIRVESNKRNMILSNKIGMACEKSDKILILTHFPPWEKACLYKGMKTDPDYIPFYCNSSLGMEIEMIATKYPDKKFEVLAGHTHDKFDGKIASNVRCRVAAAKYGSPKVEEIQIFDW